MGPTPERCTALLLICLALILAPFIRWHRGPVGPLVVAALFAGGLHSHCCWSDYS